MCLAICCFMMPLQCGALAADGIVFEDKAVEAHIRRMLEIYDHPISAEDMLRVEYFRYDPFEIWTDKIRTSTRQQGFDLNALPQITSLEDLAHCKNLWGIAIGQQPVLSDIEPLRHLTQLTNVEFLDCPSITDLSPLSGLYSLQVVSLDGIGTTDISVLSRLPNVFNFSFNSFPYDYFYGDFFPENYNTQSIDLSALAETSSLVFFYMRNHTKALDYSPLLSHTGLGEAGFVDIDEPTLLLLLSTLPSLRSMELQDTVVTSRMLAAIVAYGLDSLALTNCVIEGDMKNLADMPELYRLTLRDCNLTDISFFRGKPWALSYLDIRDNPLRDISPLASLPRLSELWISEGGEWYSRAEIEELLPDTQITHGFPMQTFIAKGDDPLPPTIQIFEGERLPLSFTPLDDGGFLLSGLHGAPAATSLSDHFMNYSELPGTQWMRLRPLSSFVSAYTASGTERWSYEMPPRDAYWQILASPTEEGGVHCTANPYQSVFSSGSEYDGSLEERFLLNAEGKFEKSFEWFGDPDLQEAYRWPIPLRDGYLTRPVPPDLSGSADTSGLPYTSILTMYDWDFSMRWQTTLDALSNHYLQTFINVKDGYLGHTIDIESAKKDFMAAPKSVFKLDAQGNLLWHHLGDGGLYYSLAEMEDGSILVIADQYYLQYAFAFYLDNNGNELWRQDYGPFSINSVRGIRQTTDGSVYGIAKRSWPDEDGYTTDSETIVLRMDLQGNPTGFMRVPQPLYEVPDVQPILAGSADALYLVGTLKTASDKIRWYILPLSPELFTADW